jgi:hypothetical protein
MERRRIRRSSARESSRLIRGAGEGPASPFYYRSIACAYESFGLEWPVISPQNLSPVSQRARSRGLSAASRWNTGFGRLDVALEEHRPPPYEGGAPQCQSRQQESRLCSGFVTPNKPSDGLEPSTPSLPSITFFLQISASGCVTRARACPRVPNLMYPSRTRAAFAVCETDDNPGAVVLELATTLLDGPRVWRRRRDVITRRPAGSR